MVLATTRTVTLTIDGQQVTVPDGTTIWAAAKAAGIEIPVLCHDERYDPVGVCRMCVVDTGARVYAAACVRSCEDGMDVKTVTPDVERSRATLTELLLADQPPATGLLRPWHRYLEPGHRREPRRLHPLRPVRPGLR